MNLFGSSKPATVESEVTPLVAPPYLMFDIGGTKMRLGVSFDGKQINQYRIVPTPALYNEGYELFIKTARELSGGKQFGSCAGGVAGSLTLDKAAIFNAPHLKDWSKKLLKHDLSVGLRCPVFLENDTAMVGLGEALYGSGKGFRIVSYVTISTGVNGARIVDGKIDASALGFEIGHQILNFDVSSQTHEFGRGELEDYISGSAIEKRYKKQPLEVDDNAFWESSARILAYGLYNTILHWSPEMVIIGGSLMKKISLEKTRGFLKEILTIFPDTPLLDTASLGELGGLYGGLAYLQRLSSR